MLHITDPHLFAEPDECLRGINTRATLQAVLDHVREADWQAEFVALTGDLVQDDSREAYRRVHSLFGSLQLPVYCVPGNHDVREIMREELRAPRFRYCAAIRHDDWMVVGVDSCLQGEAAGHVDAAELERLAACLAETDAAQADACMRG
ncbi:MAG: metallophosphoesterase, partial [Woeseiaceae bacterium]